MKKVRCSLSRKLAIMILLFAFLLAAAAACVSYYIFSKTVDDYYGNITMNLAQTAAAMVDKDLTKYYTEAVKELYLENLTSESDDEAEREAYLAKYDALQEEGYQQLFGNLFRVRKANAVLSLYIVYIDQQTETCVCIVGADASERASFAGTWDIVYEQYCEALSHPEEETTAYITKTEEFGWLCTAGAPILDEDGTVIAHAMVDISMDKVIRARYAYLFKLIFLLIILTVILTYLAIRWMNKAVVKPIDNLTFSATQYVQEKSEGHQGGEISVFDKLQISTGDEIENLFCAFRQMEQDINRYIEDITFVTAEKERIGAELNVATQIQADMLPGIFPAFPERKEFDIFASMNPAKEVGGDFYDFFLVDEDHLALVIADVSGKGVPAALFMVITKTLIKNQMLMGGSPGAVLEAVNNQLCENNEAEMFVTVWLAVYEISTGKVTAANAGHEYPAIRRAGGSFELFKDPHGFVLAGMENVRYKEYEMELHAGDTLFVYTDGVPEATDAGNTLFGTERMLEALNGKCDTDPKKLIEGVKNEIDGFVGEAMQFDDITMLSLQVAMGICVGKDMEVQA
ncbi:MAG: PP2C family protein-serine/threonine phosphatase [Lachnospiraceae bacterium]|nr:PP2C family protein-serine/threonine phosphatase [Lachnospiraceae bacterium]